MRVMSCRWILCWVVFAAVMVQLAGCATPVPRDELGSVDSFTLLKQMQWLDRDVPASFNFGAGGREAYIEAVREEILARMPHWPAEVVEAVRGHRVELGMDKGQVVTAIGWPNEYPALLWADAPTSRGPWVDDFVIL